MSKRPLYDLSGKTVRITGASRGIGAHTARRLHAKGVNAHLVGVEPNLLSDLSDELGARVAYFHADVTDTADLAFTQPAAAPRTALRWIGLALLANGPMTLLNDYLRRKAEIRAALCVANEEVPR